MAEWTWEASEGAVPGFASIPIQRSPWVPKGQVWLLDNNRMLICAWPPKRTRWQRLKALLWRAIEAVQL